MDYYHIPVLLEETIEGLKIKDDGIYVDGTVGGGGHSLEIAKRLIGGKLYSFDRDKEAVETASVKLKGLNAEVINDNYSNVEECLVKRGIKKVDGVLLDLGVSSHQLDSKERGFSYLNNSKIDMRMGLNQKSGCDVVNEYQLEKLINIFYKYGEEKYALNIAKAIVREREKERISSTKRLSEIIKKGVPQKARRDKNPSRKVFQAIRMEVNDEIYHLELGLKEAFRVLKSGGRLCVISFHSVEDRVVKNFFKQLSKGCECPNDFPICVCGKKPLGRLINKKAIKPKEEEIKNNRRSRSAILRIIEKI